MRIVFNTSQPNMACSVFYANALKDVEGLTFHDWNFASYDIALFMTYDYQHIKQVKERFPSLKIGIIDPRSNKVADSVQYCDFIIIDSVEMEDYWRRSRKPIFRYVEYPDIPYVEKIHKESDKIVIGYHGNQVHLNCMAENVTPALVELGKDHDIELLVMHNGAAPARNESWYPKNISVRHVPWSMSNYTQELMFSDIGIVPNNLIHDTSIKKLIKTNNSFNYNDDDYSLRFKMPSNPGRFVIFGKLGIPVVADFYPSALQYLKDDTGFVAYSEFGWYHCLKQLIDSCKLRQKMGNALQALVREEFDFDLQNEKLMSFFRSVLEQ